MEKITPLTDPTFPSTTYASVVADWTAWTGRPAMTPKGRSSPRATPASRRWR
jgi:hypothetical protein